MSGGFVEHRGVNKAALRRSARDARLATLCEGRGAVMDAREYAAKARERGDMEHAIMLETWARETLDMIDEETRQIMAGVATWRRPRQAKEDWPPFNEMG